MYISYICLQETPLIQAAKVGHAEIISLLVKAGAQLESKDNMEVSAWIVMLKGPIKYYALINESQDVMYIMKKIFIFSKEFIVLSHF